jgi:hypothetical protein
MRRSILPARWWSVIRATPICGSTAGRGCAHCSRTRLRLEPALDKVPPIRWQGGDAYAGSTHVAPPRALNRTSARGGEERLSAAILHRKLSAGLSARPSPTDPAHLAEHCESGREWAAIAAAQARGDGFAHPHAARYDGWRQLVDPGLMGPGHPGMTGEW